MFNILKRARTTQEVTYDSQKDTEFNYIREKFVIPLYKKYVHDKIIWIYNFQLCCLQNEISLAGMHHLLGSPCILGRFFGSFWSTDYLEGV